MIISSKKIKNSRTNNIKLLRYNSKIPAIIYDGKENIKISIPHKEFLQNGNNYFFYKKKIKIRIQSEVFVVVIKQIQLDSLTNTFIHIDFQKVSYDKKFFYTLIPIKMINYINSIGMKKGGVTTLIIKKLPVKCFHNYIPTFINIDITKLDLGQKIRIDDINLDKITLLLKSYFVLVTVTGRIEKLDNTLESESKGQSQNRTGA